MKNKVSFDSEVYEHIRIIINSYTNSRVQIFKNNRKYQKGGEQCQQENKTEMKKEKQLPQKQIKEKQIRKQKKQISNTNNLFGVDDGFN